MEPTLLRIPGMEKLREAVKIVDEKYPDAVENKMKLELKKMESRKRGRPKKEYKYTSVQVRVKIEWAEELKEVIRKWKAEKAGV